MKLLLLLLAIALAAQTPDAAQAALKAAIDKEVADGDLKSAIVLYNKVAATYKDNKPVAAQALLRLGQCHEKLGQGEAVTAYNRLLAQYADQKEATAARARLAAFARPPADGSAMSVQLVFSSSEVDISTGRVSSDGRIFPYVDSVGNIFIRDLRSGTSRQLTTSATAENSEGGRSPIPSRDGSRIAYQWGDGKQREFRVISFAGGPPRAVGPKFLEQDTILYLWDWSPDGKLLAASIFDRRTTMNSMVVMDVASGELRTLFTRQAFSQCENGSFSPDSRLLVADCRYRRSHHGLSVINVATGIVTPILAGTVTDRFPVWLPTPGKIAFVSDRRGKHGLYVTDYRSGSATPPVFVTDDIGDSRLFGTGKDGTIYYGRRNTSGDIFLANLDPASFRIQGAPVRFVEDHLGHNSGPSWSPSGASFAFVSVRDLNSGTRAIVRTPGQKDVVTAEPLNGAGSAPKWCGDSKLQIAGTPGATTRRLFDARSGAVAQPDVNIEGMKLPYQVAYSPDCGTVYISTYSHETKRRRIYGVDLDTQQKEMEIHTGEAAWAISPKVSPDGRWLAIVGSLVKDGPIGLLLHPTAGGAPRMLAENAYGWDPSVINWTPDSNHVFFLRKDGTELECFAAPIDGGPIKTTGIRGPGLIGPSLHPDGKRALYSVTTSVAEVWSLRNSLLK